MKDRIIKVTSHPLTQAVASEFPIAGGISTYFNAKIAEKRNLEISETLNEIQIRLEDLYDKDSKKIDIDHIKSADFLETLAAVVEQIVRDADKEKREYLQRFVVSWSLAERPEKIIKDLSLNFLRTLGSLHLKILALLWMKQKRLSFDELRLALESGPGPEVITVEDVFKNIEYDRDLVFTIVSQLINFGLVTSKDAGLTLSMESRLVITKVCRHFLVFLESGEE